MATVSGKGHASVVMASKPAVSKSASKGHANVSGLKSAVKTISVGKMASVPHVTLGTTRGNHSVAHAVNGKSMSC